MCAASAPTPPPSASVLRGRVLVQADDDCPDAPDLAGADGSGLVLTGEGAITAGRHLPAGFEGPVLVDRRRYAGNRRTAGMAPLTSSWLADQRQLGVPTVLTDSGYVGEGEHAALRSILDQAARAGDDVTAVLPLHQSWLRGQDLQVLLAEVVDHQVPVAVALEHEKDPLRTRWAVAGLVRLLRSAPSVALLSTDVSALGAVAFGAEWAAVGTKPGLRHLYPAVHDPVPRFPRTSALVDPLLSMVTVGKLVEGWRASPDSDIWGCPCPACRGRSPDWMLHASTAEINRHTFEMLLNRRADLAEAATSSDREQSWRAQCWHALARYDELGTALGWNRPGYLISWTKVEHR